MTDNVTDTGREGSCAQCRKKVDALLAPFTVVEGSLVLPFCSLSCKKAFIEEAVQNPAGRPRARARSKTNKGPLARLKAGRSNRPESKKRASIGIDSSGMEPLLRIAGQGPEAVALPVEHLPGLLSKWWRWITSVFLFICLIVLVLTVGAAIYGRTKNIEKPSSVPASDPDASAPVEEKDPSELERERSARAAAQRASLTKKIEKRAKKLLSGCLEQNGSRHQLLAAESLARCCNEQKGLDILLKAVSDSNWSTRQQAAHALARLGRPEGVDALMSDLKRRRRAVRLLAAFALAHLGEAAGIYMLRPLLGKKRHRLTGAEALVMLGNVRAKDLLLKILGSQKTDLPDRLRAAVALGLVGDNRGASLMGDVMSDRSKLSRVQPRLMLHMASAFVVLGDARAEKALVSALDQAEIRMEAALALHSLGTKVPVRKLMELMDSYDEYEKVTAAAAALLLLPRSRMEAR